MLGALSVTFLVNGSLTLTIGLIAAVSAAALVVAGIRRPRAAMRVERRDILLLGGLTLIGCVLAGAVWMTADVVAGVVLRSAIAVFTASTESATRKPTEKRCPAGRPA